MTTCKDLIREKQSQIMSELCLAVTTLTQLNSVLDDIVILTDGSPIETEHNAANTAVAATAVTVSALRSPEKLSLSVAMKQLKLLEELGKWENTF